MTLIEAIDRAMAALDERAAQHETEPRYSPDNPDAMAKGTLGLLRGVLQTGQEER